MYIKYKLDTVHWNWLHTMCISTAGCDQLHTVRLLNHQQLNTLKWSRHHLVDIIHANHTL